MKKKGKNKRLQKQKIKKSRVRYSNEAKKKQKIESNKEEGIKIENQIFIQILQILRGK